MLNLMNFTGRVGWGAVSDRVGRKSFYLFSTATQAFALGLMGVWISTNNFGAWLLSFLLIGSLYGGGFGVIPATVSDLFGPKISAATHGVMIAVWASATIIGVPVFTSYTSSYTVPGTTRPAPMAYIMNTYWLCAMPTISFLCLLFMNVRPRDREMRRKTGSLRVRLCSHIISIGLMGPDAQDAEAARFLDAPAALVSKAAVAIIESDSADAATDVTGSPQSVGAGAAADNIDTQMSTIALAPTKESPPALVAV